MPTTTVSFALIATLCATAPLVNPPAEGFQVTIVNQCPKAVDAHLAVIPVAMKDDEVDERIKRGLVVRLKPRSRITRTMVPYERLVVLMKSGSMSAWFESKEDGQGGRITIGADCTSISDEKGPGAR